MTTSAAPLQVCEQAGVPLRVVPLRDAYWERVVAHSIAEIRVGRTPNPDIMCNTRSGFTGSLVVMTASESYAMLLD